MNNQGKASIHGNTFNVPRYKIILNMTSGRSQEICDVEKEATQRIRNAIDKFLIRRSEISEEHEMLLTEYKDKEKECQTILEMERDEKIVQLETKFEEDLRNTARKQFEEQVAMTIKATHELEEEDEDEALLLFEESVYCGENAIEQAIQKLEKNFSARKRKIAAEYKEAISNLHDEFSKKATQLKSKFDRDNAIANDVRDKELIETRNWFVKIVSESGNKDKQQVGVDKKMQAFRRFTESLLRPELESNGLPPPKLQQKVPKSQKTQNSARLSTTRSSRY